MSLKVKNMRAYLYLFLIFSLFASSTHAGSSATIDKGNQFYKESSYSDAVANYLEVIEEGYESFELYYNLGNAYYKLEKIPEAILYYEKAKKLNPDDKDLAFNLKLVNLQTVDKIESIDQIFLNNWWDNLLNMNAPDEWAKWCIILLFIGFFLLIAYLFTPLVFLKKISFFSGTIIIFLGLFCWFLGSSQNKRLTNNTEAIIFTSNVTVKSAPEESSSKLFVIHEGTKVALIQEDDEWFEVSLSNGNSGWIKASDMRKI